MNAEDQYFIEQVMVYVTRGGMGVVDSRHIKSDDDSEYYKVSGLEERYVIRGASGIKHMPHTIYESHLSGECFFASGLLRTTKKYRRELDSTYFKYYDDAEIVMNNITKFIRWAKKLPTTLPKKTIKKISNQTSHITSDVADTQEAQRIRASQVGLKIKRRSELSPLAKDLAEERDWCQERD